jgi:hypothetical protein
VELGGEENYGGCEVVVLDLDTYGLKAGRGVVVKGDMTGTCGVRSVEEMRFM